MNSFRSMGTEVLLPDRAPLDDVRELFDARDRRFSRFQDSSELNHVNASPRGLALVSEEFASMLSRALDAAPPPPRPRPPPPRGPPVRPPRSCYGADVGPKAALLLGPAGPSWLDRRRLAGRFVDHEGRVTVSERWLQAVPLERAA